MTVQGGAAVRIRHRGSVCVCGAEQRREGVRESE